MNPLTAHLERYQKQPPLIKEDEESSGVKKRPFSNCLLFVLLAVFVFFLACLAVYAAIAMGIPVEKNEAAPLKSELPPTKDQILPDSIINKTVPKEPSKNTTNKAGNDSVVISNPTRLRIQIFIKGKDAEDSKESADLDQNKTEETPFNSFPKSGIFLRRIIFHNGLNKPEIDSSEEVSSGSDEKMKDVLGFKPFGIDNNAPNPLEMFFNLLKLTEAPIDNIFNILEKQKIKQSNSTPSIGFSEKTADNDKSINPKDQIEENFNTAEKLTNEQKSNTSQDKPNETITGKQEMTPTENEHMNQENIENEAQQTISSTEQKQHYEENEIPDAPHLFKPPVIRFFRFIGPDHPHVERPETFSPMYQRTFYQHQNPFYHGITRLPYSQENMINKGSYSGHHDHMNEVRYKMTPSRTTMAPTTMTPTTTAQTTIPPQAYSTTPSGYSVSSDKNIYRDNFAELTNHHHKETQNQIMSTSNNQNRPGMIDRIDTENIKPFEDFFKYRNL